MRLFLSTSNTNTTVTKTILQKNVWGDTSFSKVKIADIIHRADEILKDTYGYRIQTLGKKETINAKGTRKDSTQEAWGLVNNLTNEYNRFIQEAIWLTVSSKEFYSELSEKRGDYRNDKEKYFTLKSEHELIFSGVALTIVGLLVVHGNKMDEVELMNILKNDFGFDQNKQLDVLGITPIELLKQLDKTEYINRLVVAMDNGEPVVEYSVGRRAKLEFPKNNFIEFLRLLNNIQDDEMESFTKSTEAALEVVYGK